MAVTHLGGPPTTPTKPHGRYACKSCGGHLHSDRPGPCNQCIADLREANGTTPPIDPLGGINNLRLAKYRLTYKQFVEMFEAQGRACAICGMVPVQAGNLAIDHNHDTGHVRGLLCTSCNTGLGLLKDSPDVLDAAMAYLELNGCYGSNSLDQETA